MNFVKVEVSVGTVGLRRRGHTTELLMGGPPIADHRPVLVI